MNTHAQPKHTPATRHDIRDILGPLDDDKIIEIMHTGASVGDVMQALASLEGDEKSILTVSMTPLAKRVCEILTADEESLEEQAHWRA